MTLFHLLVGIALTFSWTLRPILYKPLAKNFPARFSGYFTSVWLVIALLITSPLLGGLINFNGQNALLSPYILISVYKGVSLYYQIFLQQVINKKSTSSSVFVSFIALALGCLANNLFFHENLGLVKVLCVLGFGVLGLLFLVKGDAKRLTKRELIFFILITLFMASYVVCDHIAIPQVGWYAHLLVSSVAMFVASAIRGISWKNIKDTFDNKKVIFAGTFYAFSEFLVIYASINILPVSVVGVFLRLSVPIVMIWSAVYYKEQSVKNQLTFGIVAIALALPIMFLK